MFFSSAPFFHGAASLSCYLIKRVPKEEKERMWGALKGWLIPPDREILILNLKVLIFNSLKSTAFDNTNTRGMESIAFLCKVTWTRTSSIIIHWTFCATLSVAILRRSVRSDAKLSCTETRFQKFSQSGKNGSKHPMSSISMAYNVISCKKVERNTQKLKIADFTM